MHRRYLCPVVGSGSEGDPYRPAVADVLPAGWGVEPGPDGQMIVHADATPEQHAAALALPGVVELQ